MKTQQESPESYLDIFLQFLKFGFMAWGGPVPQIAMINQDMMPTTLRRTRAPMPLWTGAVKRNNLTGTSNNEEGPQIAALFF